MAHAAPPVSVNMITYNDAAWLSEAIESVCTQSFGDFEFVIVDDGSDAASREVLEGCAARDARIRVHWNGENRGRPYSRNRALSLSQGGLVAVLDADDVMLPGRLQRQYEFMASSPKVLVCGSRFAAYETGDVFTRALENDEIRVQMLFDSPIANPTAMFRRKPVLHLTGGYDERFLAAEDYDLWERLSHTEGAQFVNLPDVLLRYRTHPEKDRRKYRGMLVHFAERVRLHQVAWLGLAPTRDERRWHTMVSGYISPEDVTPANVEGCIRWVGKLLEANRTARRYSQRLLRQRVEAIRALFTCVRDGLAGR